MVSKNENAFQNRESYVRSEMGGEKASDSFAMFFVIWSQLAHEINIKMTRPSL
jgi:hypothetical protein